MVLFNGFGCSEAETLEWLWRYNSKCEPPWSEAELRHKAHSATEAACLSAAQCLRAELRPGGVKVVNVFFGPLDTEWFQTVPPPKVAPAALAGAVVDALRRGLEDVFVGDVAHDIRQRLAVNPKALEREMADQG